MEKPSMIEKLKARISAAYEENENFKRGQDHRRKPDLEEALAFFLSEALHYQYDILGEPSIDANGHLVTPDLMVVDNSGQAVAVIKLKEDWRDPILACDTVLEEHESLLGAGNLSCGLAHGESVDVVYDDNVKLFLIDLFLPEPGDKKRKAFKAYAKALNIHFLCLFKGDGRLLEDCEIGNFAQLISAIHDESNASSDETTEWLKTKEFVTVSAIQRDLNMGYPRASRLLQTWIDKGLVEADTVGSKGHRVIHHLPN